MDATRTDRPRRIGLLGGSFDPIHRGHLHAAGVAQAAFGLDRVVFVPAARPPHKAGRALTAGAHRLAMVHLAIAGRPEWSASDLELRRPGPSYTLDTVRALPHEVGEPPDAQVFLILGSDSLAGLPGWHEVEELLRLARPIVVLRDDDGPERIDALRGALSPAALERLASGVARAPRAVRAVDGPTGGAGARRARPRRPAGERSRLRRAARPLPRRARCAAPAGAGLSSTIAGSDPPP